MSANSSFTSNTSLDSEHFQCLKFTITVLLTYDVIKFLLLIPLCIFILVLAYQRWRRQQQRSFKTTTHSDIFTYHVAVLELVWGLGMLLFTCGLHNDLPKMMTAGRFFFSVTFGGEISFHVLTCVERYLAVVHPVAYLGLRSGRGVRIRNISVGCVWLLCFIWGGVACVHDPILPIIQFFCILVSGLAVISFCSLSVLCVLIRPGPGEGGGDRAHVDRSKQRAFFTIVAILAVLLLWLLWFLVTGSLAESGLLNSRVSCVLRVSGYWCNLPSSLVLPLLYLHKNGKLSCSSHNTESQ